MNVETITMDQSAAEVTFRQYEEALCLNENHRLALSEREREEYEAARKGYRALADGTPVILLSKVIREAPADAKGRPMLAVARADREQVRVAVGTTETVFDCSIAPGWRTAPESLIRRIEVDKNPAIRWPPVGWALVPMVPAGIRQQTRRALRRCWILWEVEEWADKRIGAEPPIDPLLLAHLGGDAYAVLAAWELTPLERAVMEGRAR